MAEVRPLTVSRRGVLAGLGASFVVPAALTSAVSEPALETGVIRAHCLAVGSITPDKLAAPFFFSGGVVEGFTISMSGAERTTLTVLWPMHNPEMQKGRRIAPPALADSA